MRLWTGAGSLAGIVGTQRDSLVLSLERSQAWNGTAYRSGEGSSVSAHHRRPRRHRLLRCRRHPRPTAATRPVARSTARHRRAASPPAVCGGGPPRCTDTAPPCRPTAAPPWAPAALALHSPQRTRYAQVRNKVTAPSDPYCATSPATPATRRPPTDRKSRAAPEGHPSTSFIQYSRLYRRRFE